MKTVKRAVIIKTKKEEIQTSINQKLGRQKRRFDWGAGNEFSLSNLKYRTENMVS